MCETVKNKRVQPAKNVINFLQNVRKTTHSAPPFHIRRTVPDVKWENLVHPAKKNNSSTKGVVPGSIPGVGTGRRSSVGRARKKTVPSPQKNSRGVKVTFWFLRPEHLGQYQTGVKILKPLGLRIFWDVGESR